MTNQDYGDIGRRGVRMLISLQLSLRGGNSTEQPWTTLGGGSVTEHRGIFTSSVTTGDVCTCSSPCLHNMVTAMLFTAS